MLNRVFARLSRRTSGGRYIPEVDGIRFVAIGMVLLFHANVLSNLASGRLRVLAPFGVAVGGASIGPQTFVDRIIDQGQFGVQLFFILSGFILALPFAAEGLIDARRVSLRRYFARRVTRLEPPYFVASTLCLLVALLFSFGPSPRSLVRHYLLGLGYLHTLAYNEHNLLNSPFWSLEVEVQFYILLPLLALTFKIQDRIRRRGLLVLGILAATLLEGAVVLGSRRLALSIAGELQYFLAGLLLADIYVGDWRQEPGTDARWDFVSLVGWPVLFIGLASGVVFQRLAMPWLGIALFAAVLRGPITRRVMSNRWIRTIGGMAYSIYLLHYPLMVGLSHAGFSGLFFVVLAVSLALVCGLIFYVLIERPCMEPDWPQRLRARVAGRHPSSA